MSTPRPASQGCQSWIDSTRTRTKKSDGPAAAVTMSRAMGDTGGGDDDGDMSK
jgi:hypothetical protein